ncbi:MAG: FAD-linked oxidase C-terminal domain-containing protein [Pseudomonadota bacterium]
MKTFLQALQKILADKVLTETAACIAYSYDNSAFQNIPIAVVFAHNEQDVIDTVKLCYQHEVPITARGRGSNTTGASIAAKNGVVLSFEHMYQIKQFDVANRTISVEPGIANQSVQDHVAKQQFFWPCDPSSGAYSTIGGNLACCAAGPHAIKYGTARENTLKLRAVIGTGEVIETGYYTAKGAVGYDLTRLLIGSEGTLGIITEATLKLLTRPEAKATFQAIYASIEACAEVIIQLMASPATPAVLEFMDAQALQLIRQHQQVELPENAQALLMIEVDGLQQGIEAQCQMVSQIANSDHCLAFSQAKTPAAIKALWQLRRALSPTLKHAAPNKINEDIVVPISKMPTLLAELQKLAQKYQIKIVNFGHAGSGNIHVNIMYDAKDAKQNEHAQACLEEVFTIVLKLNGTLSGEHGIGLAKKPFVAKEIDANTLNIMRAIKQQFDPKNILNPGKIFD